MIEHDSLATFLDNCVALAVGNHDDTFIYELPYELGAGYKVSQGYGGSFSHTGASHFSLDFKMPSGTPVCAARSGVVLTAIDKYSEGGKELKYKGKDNRIEVVHQDGSVACYAHLAYHGVLVKCGQYVKSGDVIGLSGNTGWSGGPHLHFHVAGGNSQQRLATMFRTSVQAGAHLEKGNRYRRPRSRGLDPPSTDASRPRDMFVNSLFVLTVILFFVCGLALLKTM